MRNRIWTVVLLPGFLTALLASRAAGSMPSCAVLPFETDSVLSEEDGQALMYRFDAALRREGAFEVMTRGEVGRRLAIRKHDPAKYSSGGAAALGAGVALGVDYVIFGTVEQKGNRWYLETSLIDVQRHRYVGRIRSFLDDTRERFLVLAPASNARDLLMEYKPRQSQRQTPSTSAQRPGPPVTTGETSKPSVDAQPAPATPPGSPKIEDLGFDIMTETDMDSPFYLVAEKLEVGTRMIVRTLLSENKDNFLGSIDHLELDEDLLPTDIFVAWFFTEDLGIEFEWDTIEADTITTQDGHNDGRVELTGPVVSLMARFPIRNAREPFLNCLTPYTGVGIAVFSGHFEPEGWWHNGFSHPDWHTAQKLYTDWLAAGQPPWPNGGYQRTLSVDNTIGFLLTGGCTAAIAAVDGLSVDMYLRYMNVKSDTTVVLSRYERIIEDERTAALPLHNLTFGLGVRYAF